MESDAAAFIALRLASLAATPGFVGGQAARERLCAYPGRAGAVHRVVRRHGRAIGQLYFVRDPDAWFGGPIVLGWVDRDPSDERALDALLAAVDAHADALDGTTLIEIRVDDGPLLAGLRARGFGLDSVIQLGDPKVALTALGDDDQPLGARGLALAPLRNAHVPAVVELHRAAFSAEPAFCWFGAFPSHLERMTRSLLHDPRGHFALVDQAGRVLGHLGAELADTPYWGPTGGLELVLAPEVRGQGLTRSLYRAALRSLVARGARVMKGGTSQPAILSLGRRMRRPWHAFNLRRGAAFAAEHFLAFAPDEVRRAHGLG